MHVVRMNVLIFYCKRLEIIVLQLFKRYQNKLNHHHHHHHVDWPNFMWCKFHVDHTTRKHVLNQSIILHIFSCSHTGRTAVGGYTCILQSLDNTQIVTFVCPYPAHMVSYDPGLPQWNFIIFSVLNYLPFFVWNASKIENEIKNRT